MMLATLFFRPVLPPIVLFAIAALLVTSAVFAYRGQHAPLSMRVSLLGMRVLAILALTTLLFGPSVVPPTSDRETKPGLSVLIDVSASMQTVDCDDRSRLDALRDTWLRPTTLDSLERIADVDYQFIGAQREPVSRSSVEGLQSEAANAEATKLFETLGDALATKAPTAARRLLVLSDGRDTSGGSAGAIAELARSRGVPIDTVCVGAAVQRRDLAVQVAPTQEFLYAEEEGGLLLRVHQTGLPVSIVELELQVSGPEGTSSQRHSLDLRGRTVAETLVPIRHETPGQYAYLVQAVEQPEERDTVNNKSIVFVDVSKAKAQVLMLEGQPSWDMKFVAQSLRKDPRVELTQISRLSEKRTEVIRSGGTQGAKSDLAEILSPEGLARVDVFILGSGLERVITPEAAAVIRDRVVEHGAGVIFSRGPAYDPTSDAIAAAFSMIEPVCYAERSKSPFTNVSIELAPAARSMPWLSKEQLGVDLERESMRLAPWQRVYVVRDVKPSAIVLASIAPSQGAATEANDAQGQVLAPVVVSMRTGSGIALSILGEGMWKWALVDRERAAFQGVYERWWQGMVRWSASGGDARPGHDVTLRLSQQSARLSDRVGIEVLLERTLLQPPTEVRVQLPSGRMERLPLAPHATLADRLEASLQPSEPGVYIVTLETPNAEPPRQQRLVNVVDPSVERINPSADPIGMRELAERSGGGSFRLDAAESYASHLHRREIASIASQEATWAWNRLPILLMLCAWIGCEWILRRKAGLP